MFEKQMKSCIRSDSILSKSILRNTKILRYFTIAIIFIHAHFFIWSILEVLKIFAGFS